MTTTRACAGCQNGTPFPIEFTMAFHPIVNVRDSSIWGYEALVRGKEGESAYTVLQAVNAENRYAFDQACRVKAIDLAGAKLGANGQAKLSINFMPNAVYEPRACIQASLKAASRAQFSPSRIMFEFTENEEMRDIDHVNTIVEAYRHIGFITAIDDFGAGFAGLNLLSDLRPDVIKIDMDLIRAIDSNARKQAIVSGIVAIANSLSVDVIAEGVETASERDSLVSAGIGLLQGYLFARPQLETFQPYGDLQAA